jgi:dephospho-CoA kinase
MLKSLGAPIIDFDILAREVQEPGQPAYQEIVDFFGPQVKADDGTLDRNQLSKIVFADHEKKKKLESFTHPRIAQAFVQTLDQIARNNPNAIVQAVVPLLIEVKMQYMMDKLLVVFAAEQVQVERLMRREGIGEQRALQMVRSQLSIEEKKRHADYVIDNGGPQTETEKQVRALWPTLRKAQQQQSGTAL